MTNLQLTADHVSLHLTKIELPARRNGVMGSFADEIVRYGSFVGSSIECFANLPRAMEYSRSHIDIEENSGRSVKNGRVIIAEQLTGSKGRFTRTWHAPPGGLWGCFIHANSLMPQSALLLSFAVGIAACEALREYGAESTYLRWVNDVLIEGAKTAGFLIESYTGPKWGEQFHLVGFGINVNNHEFPDDIEKIATSLSSKIKEPVDLQDFSLSFISKLAWNIGLLYFVEAKTPDWASEGSECIHPIIARWKELSDTVGQRVLFGYDVTEKPQYSASVTGIGADGGLQMVLDDGLEITEHSGEIRYL